MSFIYFKVFITGFVICALVQCLMEKTKLMPGRIMVILVCSGAILGMLGIYDKIIEFGQAGATVPLLGFGYQLWTGVKEAVDVDGFIGIFTGGLEKTAAGITGSLVFAYIASLICQSKIKK